MKKYLGWTLLLILALEVSLHITSFGVRWWTYRNQKVVQSSQAQFKILCIGESTTIWGGEESYPSYLQKILDQKKGPGYYQVFNRGIPGANSTRLLNELPNFLNDIQPQLVIVMAGINDYWGTIDNNSPRWLKILDGLSPYSQMAKIIKNILVNIEYRKKSDIDMSQAANCGGHNQKIESYLKEAKEILKSQSPQKSADYIKEKLKDLMPDGVCSIADPLQFELISIQQHQLKNPMAALQTVEKILDGYLIPYKRSLFLEKKKELRASLNLSVEEKIEISAENYWENSTYKINIQNIIGEIQKNKIPVIMMQYPLLPLSPIKDNLLDHAGVTFMDNQENFENLLKKKSFDEVFDDKFGGVFGHFRGDGSNVMATKLSEIILNMETQGNSPGSIK